MHHSDHFTFFLLSTPTCLSLPTSIPQCHSAAGAMKEEMDSVNMKDSLSKLADHSSSKLASQASSILTMLSDTS